MFKAIMTGDLRTPEGRAKIMAEAEETLADLEPDVRRELTEVLAEAMGGVASMREETVAFEWAIGRLESVEKTLGKVRKVLKTAATKYDTGQVIYQLGALDGMLTMAGGAAVIGRGMLKHLLECPCAEPAPEPEKPASAEQPEGN